MIFLRRVMCKLNTKNRGRRIDPCIRNLFNHFSTDSEVVASCCGHGKYPLSIVIKTRWKGVFLEIMSQQFIHRSKRFYRKDEQGYYYIPEVLE